MAATIVLTALVAQPAALGDDRGDDGPRRTVPAAAAGPTVTTLPYRTELLGIEEGPLRSLLQDSLDRAVAGQRAPETLAGIERRTQNHVATLETVLRAEGYYSGKLSFRIDDEIAPVAVIIDIDHGPRYIVKQFLVEYSGPGSTDADLPRTLADLGMKLAGPARSEFVLDAEERQLERLAELGRPLAKASDRKVVVDHADATMSVILQIAPGSLARFGELTVEHPPTVEEDYIRGFITWHRGDVFARSRIGEFRTQLLNTGLFDSVAVERAGSLNEAGELPITVRVSERKHRSVGFEGHWSTDEGFGVELFWEHRNLLGRQEQFAITARLEEIRQEFELDFRKPRYLRQNQTLLANAVGGNQETDAYQGPLATGFAGLERRLSAAWSVSAGIRAEASNLQDYQGTRDFQVLGVSFRGLLDTSDDRLDPSRGARLRLALTPYLAGGTEQLSFVEADVGGSAYYPLRDDHGMILAARARLGRITGENAASLPANRRFYAGGGTSIRGYALQSVGPLAADGTPLGGITLVELGTEVRVKVTDTLGGVVFFEGGSVDDELTTDAAQNFRWAAGFGVRYFTAVGPLRLDFGFPLDRRPSDDVFQFYISIGQAF